MFFFISTCPYVLFYVPRSKFFFAKEFGEKLSIFCRILFHYLLYRINCFIRNKNIYDKHTILETIGTAFFCCVRSESAYEYYDAINIYFLKRFRLMTPYFCFFFHSNCFHFFFVLFFMVYNAIFSISLVFIFAEKSYNPLQKP